MLKRELLEENEKLKGEVKALQSKLDGALLDVKTANRMKSEAESVRDNAAAAADAYIAVNEPPPPTAPSYETPPESDICKMLRHIRSILTPAHTHRY